jgi:hypothetical protein
VPDVETAIDVLMAHAAERAHADAAERRAAENEPWR